MIITLCGSSRFEAAFHYWNMRLSLDGHVVIGMTSYPSLHGGKKDWFTATEKELLDAVHKRKIDNSDAIFVIDQAETDGPSSTPPYIGESTLSEINHARQIPFCLIFRASEAFEIPRSW